LVIDDDPQIRALLKEYLAENGLRVSIASTGEEMSKVLGDEAVDLVVLDLRLAGEDGMTIARSLRDQSSIPIVMLTGVRDEADRVMGLELGADDYITKPFSPRELLARIRTVLRRTKSAGSRIGATARNSCLPVRRVRTQSAHAAAQATDGGHIVLTNGEFNLLAALLSAPERILTRDQLLEASRVYDNEVYDRAIDIQVLRLRSKDRVLIRFATEIHRHRARRGLYVLRADSRSKGVLSVLLGRHWPDSPSRRPHWPRGQFHDQCGAGTVVVRCLTPADTVHMSTYYVHLIGMCAADLCAVHLLPLSGNACLRISGRARSASGWRCGSSFTPIAARCPRKRPPPFAASGVHRRPARAGLLLRRVAVGQSGDIRAAVGTQLRLDPVEGGPIAVRTLAAVPESRQSPDGRLVALEIQACHELSHRVARDGCRPIWFGRRKRQRYKHGKDAKGTKRRDSQLCDGTHQFLPFG
jgi:two-component system OmpR family response regulator